VNFRPAANKSGAAKGDSPDGTARRHHARGQGVLSIRAYRRLWIALSLSSLGDWLSIFALLALAAQLTQRRAVDHRGRRRADHGRRRGLGRHPAARAAARPAGRGDRRPA
jgi:hypothetical protein